MAAVDLTHIIYRAHEEGDIKTSKTVGNIASGTVKVSLAGIKFRANTSE